MNHSTVYWAAILFLLLTFSGCKSAEPAPDPPNILWIMTDQLPVNCLSVYGNRQIQTPHLEALAASGHVLEHFYIAAFPCSPSRASMLSGRWLHRHNVFTNNVLMDPHIPTLGTIARAAGYATGYFGKAHLGGSMYVGRTNGDGIDYMHDLDDPEAVTDPVGDEITQYWHRTRVEGDSGWQAPRQEGGPGEDAPQLGFDTWRGGWKDYKNWLVSQGQERFAQFAGNHDALQSAPEGQHMYSLLGEEFHMARYFTDETNAFISEHSTGSKPWTAVLSYFGPHLPVAPPRPWDTMYALEEIPLPDNFEDDLGHKPAQQGITNASYLQGAWTEDQYRDYIRRYWGYTSYIDARIGEVMDTLRATGQWSNTLIIFTSDHGDMVGGHGMIFKLGNNAYEELFRMPAIIKLPGEAQGGHIHPAITSSIDLLPTTLDIAGVPLPEGIDGTSLLPLMQKKQEETHPYIFAEIHPPGRGTKTIMCRNDRYKLAYHWSSDETDELYDLQQDPGELRNLIEDPTLADVRSELEAAIWHWADSTGHAYADLIGNKMGR